MLDSFERKWYGIARKSIINILHAWCYDILFYDTPLKLNIYYKIICLVNEKLPNSINLCNSTKLTIAAAATFEKKYYKAMTIKKS